MFSSRTTEGRMATEVPDRIDRFQASYGTSARLNLWLNAHTVCGEIQRSVGGTGRPVLDLRGTNSRERGGVCALQGCRPHFLGTPLLRDRSSDNLSPTTTQNFCDSINLNLFASAVNDSMIMRSQE